MNHIDILPRMCWEAFNRVAVHSPLLVQPMTIFVLTIDLPLLLFHYLDFYGSQLKWAPKSLHPESGRIYKNGRQGPFALMLFTLSWNLFPLIIYFLVDQFFSTSTSILYSESPVDFDIHFSKYSYTISDPIIPVNSTYSQYEIEHEPVHSVHSERTFIGNLISTVMYPTVPEDLISNEMVPGLFKLVVQVSMLLILWDIIFYFVHRALHTRFFFKYFHHVHHEVKYSHSIIIYYVSFIDGLINYGAIVASPLLLSFLGSSPYSIYHPMSLMIFYAIVGLLGACSHSGYDVAFASSRYHFVHHMRGNSNYGAIGLMDYIFETYESMEAAASKTKNYYLKGKKHKKLSH